ncbi:MAG: aminotransferase class I/II-fold pyridoxal phosphate-dependent enzyme [Candidatus Thermoplasmatota archaeon]|nr:aminotransferase class I/II-fold pyridoxal phosphate-dependent enzyme [Candidatus Thermoplasmatota archaeon]
MELLIPLHYGTNSHGGNIWNFSRKHGIDPLSVLDYSSNLNDFNPVTMDEIKLKESWYRAYPDTDLSHYVTRLSEWSQMSPEQILLGPGLTYLIYRICQLNRGKKALIIEPCFSEYERAARSSEMTVDTIQSIDLQGMSEKIAQRNFDLLFVASPSNPVGTSIPPNELIEIIDYARKKGATVFIDEAFVDFSEQYQRSFPSKILGDYENVIFGRSLTKLFGMASVRMGYLMSAKRNTELISMLMEPWALGQFAAEIISTMDYNRFKDLPSQTSQERRFLITGVENLRLKILGTPSANYFVFSFPGDTDVSRVVEELGESGIMIKELGDFMNDGKRYARISVKNRANNTIFLKALEKAMTTGRKL